MKKSLALICVLLAAACGEDASTGGAERAAYPDASTPEGAGRLSFGQCAVCHTAAQGQPHRIGPNLYGVVGATAGKMDGFAYSAAMRDSGVVWILRDATLRVAPQDEGRMLLQAPQAFKGAMLKQCTPSS